MKTSLFAGFIALIGVCYVSAQAQSVVPLPLPSIEADRNPQWVVKFSPLSLFDPTNTIQFGVERFVGARHSLQLEIGYGWQGMNLWQSSGSNRYSHIQNWRERVEWRYYGKGGPIGSYIAIEGLFKQITGQENGTIGVGCETGPCQYYQLFSSPLTKHVWAGHVKFGRQFALSADKRWVGDFYGGLGVRGNRVDRQTLTTGQFFYNDRGFSLFDPFSSTNYPFLSISYGIKFGYSF